MVKKKSKQMKVGEIYWQGAYGKYRLYQVTTKTGGTKTLSPPLTKKEAKMFTDGWNLSDRRRRKLKSP